MTRRLRFSRSTSAPPVERISQGETGERPRATTNADVKLEDVAPPQLCKIIKDVGAHGKRQSRKDEEKRCSNPKSSSGGGELGEIQKIIKDIAAHDQTITQKDTPNRSTSKSSRSSHPGIQKIVKEIGAYEHKSLQREPSAHRQTKSVGSAHPEIQQIIKEVAMSERRRSSPNQSTTSSRPLSRRASLSFLRRSKSVLTPKPAPPPEVPEIPEVVVVSPISPVNGRSKRSASAPTPPCCDLLDAATLEALAIMPPPPRPSRPTFTNATPRAAPSPPKTSPTTSPSKTATPSTASASTLRQRSTSVGQYSLFPKTSPTPSPHTSPVIRPVRPRNTLPPLPPVPALDKEPATHKPKALSTSALPNEPEPPKLAMRKLSIQIPVKEERPIPEVEPEQPPTRPSSSHSTMSRKSKRVTFCEAGPEIIGPSSRKSSPERTTKSSQTRPSWSSVLLLSDPNTTSRPTLSRHASLPASAKNPVNTKSILRRTNSLHANAVDGEAKATSGRSTPERIPENPMMVKNLKRLPRRNTRKNQPLPASMSGASSETSPAAAAKAQSPSTKYIRHPVIIPILPTAATSSSSALSTPTSTRSSYYSSSASDYSSASSRTSYSSSGSTEEPALFRTVSEPVRFVSLSPAPPLPTATATSATVFYSDSPTLPRGTPPILPSSSMAATRPINYSWTSGHTATKAATIAAAQKEKQKLEQKQKLELKEREGRWLKSRGHGSLQQSPRARSQSSTPPPVPPLPTSVGAF